LPIRIHSTDTAGFSDILFALFDLLGLQFAPRLAGPPATRLWLTGFPHKVRPATQEPSQARADPSPVG
jgi:TnpA family transposase